MRHVERALELHHIAEPHYNCCQSVVIPFAESLGLDPDAFYQAAAQFGSGAVTGGLMALGLLGADNQTAVEFQRRFREQAGALDCSDLLRAARENGESQKSHCDRMVAAAVALAEELTAAK